MKYRVSSTFGGLRDTDGVYRTRYVIDVTYDCNLGCKDCLKMLGVLPWSERGVFITEEEICKAGELLRRHRIKPTFIRVSGGEPALHPDLERIHAAILRGWGVDSAWIYTNGVIPIPKHMAGWKARVVGEERKKANHAKFYISPADLGVPMTGKSHCHRNVFCGKLFSPYGFAACDLGPMIGRLMGIDAFHPYPVSDMPTDLCRHCIESVDKKTKSELRVAVDKGEIEYPTKFYQEGFKRAKQGSFHPKRFLDRLREVEGVQTLGSKGD